MKKLSYNYHAIAETPILSFLMVDLLFSECRFNIPCAAILIAILLTSIIMQIIALKQHAFKKEVLISGICLAFLLCLLYIYSFITKSINPDVWRFAAILVLLVYYTYIIAKESNYKRQGIVPDKLIDYQTVKLVLIYSGVILFW